MAFPGANVHRRNRRQLGAGQFALPAAIVPIVTGAANTMTLTYPIPVNVAGPILATVATRTIVSQTVVSPTVVNILFSGTLATFAWTVPSPSPTVSTYQGGAVLGGAGTF